MVELKNREEKKRIDDIKTLILANAGSSKIKKVDIENVINWY